MTTPKAKLLTKNVILAKKDVATEEVHVPEWDGYVLVRGMTGAERDQWEASQVDPDLSRQWKRMNATQRRAAVQNRMRNIRARLVVNCVVDENGERIFGSEDIEDLGNKSGAAINRIYEVAARLSGIRDEDVEEIAESIEEDPTASSSSNSA